MNPRMAADKCIMSNETVIIPKIVILKLRILFMTSIDSLVKSDGWPELKKDCRLLLVDNCWGIQRRDQSRECSTCIIVHSS